MKKTTSWGQVAGWYDALLSDADSYQSQVILPHLLRIVAPKPGMAILDLGCGQGFFSQAFAEKGAGVTGVDISKELVGIASQSAKDKNLKIDFKVSSADKLGFLRDHAFDAAVCVLAAQNIKELDRALAECSRVIRKGGKMILVLNHPAFRIPQMSDWHFDEIKKQQGRVVYQYLSEKEFEIVMNPGAQGDRKNVTYSYHRPLQVYVKWLSKQGFGVTRLEEWVSHKKSQKGPRGIAEDMARKEIPLFMCIEATLF